MPIEVGIWKLGAKLQRVRMSSLDSESRLEDCLCEDLSILAPDLMLIGRQIPTDYGKFIDLLAMDTDGNLTVIELKRDRTPREVVAQILDYASWVQSLSYDDIVEIYADKNNGRAFEEGFADAFDTVPPEKLNESHSLIIVSAELDPATERIINYLSDNFGVPINAIFFQYFKEGDTEFLTRTWLIDPQEAEAKSSRAAKKKEREPWNGQDFYVNFGDGSETGEGVYRSWEDAREFGYISGGGGSFYSRTLTQLFPGARVFVYIPKNGYVAVGKVEGQSTPQTEFTVAIDGKQVPVTQAPLKCDECLKTNDPETMEYFVPVRWIKTVPKEQAYREKGFFSNQNTVCKLRNRFTLERLTQHFGVED
jgi:hypothetical protein